MEMIETQIPGRPAGIGPQEWALRLELAAFYRLVAALGWHEQIFNHITLRVPGPERAYLINPFGLNYEEVTARNLVKVDLAGNILSDSDYPINRAGFIIHSAVHGARDDAHCIAHTHTTAVSAVAGKRDGLRFDNFYAVQFHGRVAYHDFEGLTTDPDEQVRLVRDMGTSDVLILRNHGVVVAGPHVPSTFYALWAIQRACEIQLAMDSMAGPNATVDPSVFVENGKRPPTRSNPNNRANQEVFDAALRRAGITYAGVA